MSQLFGLGRSTISKCIHDVSCAIIQHIWSVYVRLPSSQEATQSMNRWRMQTSIPGIVGAIDGTHISIRKPCRNGEAYFNRKSFYSLNVQGTKHCQGFIANVTSYVSEVGVRVLRECYDEGGDRCSLNGNVTKTECTKARSRRLLTIKLKEPKAPRQSIYKKQMWEKHKLKLRNKCLKQ